MSSSLFLHLFHWPSIPEYQKNLLRYIALPTGSSGQIYYKPMWVNKSLEDNMQSVNSVGCDAVLWMLNCIDRTENGVTRAEFQFAVPIRLLHIRQMTLTKSSKYCFDFVAGKFVDGLPRVASIDALSDVTHISYGGGEIPFPGQQKGFAFQSALAPNISTCDDIVLESLEAILQDVNNSARYPGPIHIKDFPIVRIDSLDNVLYTHDGRALLPYGKSVKANISFWQSERNRWRSLEIGGSEFDAQGISDELSVPGPKKSSDPLEIGVKAETLSYKISLPFKVVRPFHLTKVFSLAVLFFMSLLLFIAFLVFFPDSKMETKTALGFPLLAFLLNKAWDVLSAEED